MSVAQEQDEGLYPYRTAVLDVKNGSKEPITGLAIKNSRGGVTYIYDCNIPPESGRTLTIGLPATDIRQSYEVRPLTSTGPAEKAVTCEIIWPSGSNLVNPEEFVDQMLYRNWEARGTDQPGYNKKTLILLGLLLLLVESGVLSFVRRTRLKILLAVVGAVGVFAAAWIYLGRQEAVTRAEYYTNLPGLPSQADGKCRTTVLLSHRTVPWSSDDWQAMPIYFSNYQMYTDNAEIHVGKDIRMTLRPGELRIIRRYFWPSSEPLPSSGPAGLSPATSQPG